jgi:AcrR family transcriptional regulator
VSTTPLLGRPVGANSDETRQRILEATMRCVAEMGYSRATVREIARVAQMTSGSLYHYFPNKAELVAAVLAEFVDVALPRLVEAANRPGSVLDRLTGVLDEGDRLMHDYPFVPAFHRAIRVESAQHLHLAEKIESTLATLRNAIADIIAQGEHEGALGPDVDVESASNAIFSLVRGLTEHAATVPDDYHATSRALKQLIRGTLFDYNKLS